MILKVVDENGAAIAAIHVYENNYNGEVSVNDTYHCDVEDVEVDSIFGTNDQEVVIQLNQNLKRLDK